MNEAPEVKEVAVTIGTADIDTMLDLFRQLQEVKAEVDKAFVPAGLREVYNGMLSLLMSAVVTNLEQLLWLAREASIARAAALATAEESR